VKIYNSKHIKIEVYALTSKVPSRSFFHQKPLRIPISIAKSKKNYNFLFHILPKDLALLWRQDWRTLIIFKNAGKRKRKLAEFNKN